MSYNADPFSFPHPTVLINLGSSVNYDEVGAVEMVKAVRVLLDNSKVRVLWKFNRRYEYSYEFLDVLNEEIRADRVRMSKWIKVDPLALLETGDIVVSVHHGGANCFHEAIGTGIPQEVLPMWIDLYDFVIRVEYLGSGYGGVELLRQV